MPNRTAQFAGFKDWIEIFSAGTHTDASGKTREFTTGDLDQIVANHSVEHPAPAVIGHPKSNDPAYGWTGGGLKRVGNKLLALFTQVEPAFEKMVQDGRFRNRSIKIAKGDNGFVLQHVGFLGAAPPAVEGLKPIQFSASTVETYEFDWGDGYNLSLIARGMRRLREFFIATYGQEKADVVMPDDDIASLERAAVAEQLAPDPDGAPAPSPMFTATAKESPVPDKTFTQADLDAAAAKASETEKAARVAAEARVAEFERSQRLDKSKVVVSQLIGDGRLLPAQAEGLAEFMATLDDGADFEFTAADGAAVKKPRANFLQELLSKLPVQIEFQRRKATDNVTVNSSDPNAIANAALAYQKAEGDKGREVSIAEAVTHVTASKAA